MSQVEDEWQSQTIRTLVQELFICNNENTLFIPARGSCFVDKYARLGMV